MQTALVMIVAFATAANPQRATIRGEVRDAAGRGIAEARIDVLDAKPLVGEPLFTGYLDCNKFVFTDRRGRFEIANLDPTLQFRLRAVAVDHKSTFTDWFRPTDAGITIQIAEQPDDVPVNRIVFGKMVDSSLADRRSVAAADRRQNEYKTMARAGE